ncbi:hypothetical protein BDY24DRAFT_415928 [Mrakia frigida]|uniref:uncharacterized protein n=1 Tax=Mrakia frigida TaxID=29902 RepID=UPI003FCC0BDF
MPYGQPVLIEPVAPHSMKTLRLATLGFGLLFVVSSYIGAAAEEEKVNMTRRKYGMPEKKYMDGKFKIFSLGANY